MNKTKENIVIIFAKKPARGKVKTRIARETSQNFALEFSLACFSDLVNKTKESFCYDLVVGVDTLGEIAWFEKNYGFSGFLVKPNKRAGNQSDKFHYIFSSLLNPKGFNYKKAILIPMDLPFLSEEDLVTAFARLDHYQFVHGPEINGGIYLIGIKAPYPRNVFESVRWSTPYSFDDLSEKCKKFNDSLYKLKYKTDLNTFHNILEAKEEIANSCPNLYLLLKKNGYYLSDSKRYIDYDTLSICVPVVSALIEKIKKNNIQLLIQTRYKPSIDPRHSGLIEIPSGLIEKYEPIEKVIVKEVEEETGIKCEVLNSENSISTINLNGHEEVSATFKPFWCGQQLKGDRAHLNIVFLCKYISGRPKENYQETKNPQWISLEELRKIVEKEPEKIFSLHLPILIQYLKSRGM